MTHAASSDLATHLLPLLKAAGVDLVELNVLERRPSFRGADVSDAARAITGPARDEHLARGFGFFEFVLSASVHADPPTRAGLLEGALVHNSEASIRTACRINELGDDLAAGRYEQLPPRTLVNLVSEVAVGSEVLHLPMLDLGVASDETGRRAALDALAALGVAGVVFDSGRSYHFYGAKPVPWVDAVAFLARAQLLAPIVDTRWISHQLIDGRCGLRISTDLERSVRPISYVGTV